LRELIGLDRVGMTFRTPNGAFTALAPVTRWLTNLFADGAAKTVAKAIVRR